MTPEAPQTFHEALTKLGAPAAPVRGAIAKRRKARKHAKRPVRLVRRSRNGPPNAIALRMRACALERAAASEKALGFRASAEGLMQQAAKLRRKSAHIPW